MTRGRNDRIWARNDRGVVMSIKVMSFPHFLLSPCTFSCHYHFSLSFPRKLRIQNQEFRMLKSRFRVKHGMTEERVSFPPVCVHRTGRRKLRIQTLDCLHAIFICHSRESGNPDFRLWIPHQVMSPRA